jgi:hypothetical protein
MSNTKRPTTARKVTRSTEENRQDALEQGVRITLDGESYEVRLADVTPNLTRELRRQTGMSFNQLMREVVTDPDLDSLAGFAWMARRIAGESLEIDDVMVTYAQILDEGFEVATPGKRTEDDDPEA